MDCICAAENTTSVGVDVLRRVLRYCAVPEIVMEFRRPFFTPLDQAHDAPTPDGRLTVAGHHAHARHMHISLMQVATVIGHEIAQKLFRFRMVNELRL